MAEDTTRWLVGIAQAHPNLTFLLVVALGIGLVIDIAHGVEKLARRDRW